MNKDTVTPEMEYSYLNSYAKVSVYAGSTLFLLSLAELIYGWLPTWFAGSILLIGLVVFFALLFSSFGKPELNQFSYWFSRQAWFGEFNDEFLNMVSLKAYKISSFAVLIVVVIGMAGGLNSVSDRIEECFKFIFGLAAISYGLTVKIHLSADNE